MLKGRSKTKVKYNGSIRRPAVRITSGMLMAYLQVELFSHLFVELFSSICFAPTTTSGPASVTQQVISDYLQLSSGNRDVSLVRAREEATQKTHEEVLVFSA